VLKKFRIVNMAGSLGGVESLAEIPWVFAHECYLVVFKNHPLQFFYLLLVCVSYLAQL
jgi:hypothetical protein